MLSSIKRNVSNITRRTAFQIAVLGAALSLATAGGVSAQEEDEEEEGGSVEEEEAPDESTEEEEAEATRPSGKLTVGVGAPRPPAQTPGIAPPAPPPGAAPAAPTIKLGGGFILAYFQPYNMGEEARAQGRPTPKANFETFRAAILLDSKIDRFGVHMEFRARDKRVREFFESTAWLEEIYGSVDILRPENATASAVLKVGKSFAQFGRFWDDSFYGNVHLRDGLKLDSNYGLSLEGQVGKRQFGAKFFGQYFILDGGTNTSLNNRDTVSVAAPVSGFPPTPPAGLNSTPASTVSLGRRRNIFIGRVEPFFALNPYTTFKIAGSVSNFTADFGPTLDGSNVVRYGADATAIVSWFSAWAEYTVQKGNHVLGQPFGPGPAVTSQPDPFGRGNRGPLVQQSSDDIRYLLAGGRVFYKGIMLRYNFSSAEYRNTPYGSATDVYTLASAVRYPIPSVDVKETMHVPGIMISATQQLFLMIEAPIHKRHVPAANVPDAIPERIPRPDGTALTPRATLRGAFGERDLVIDRSIVVTLHARI